MPEITRKVLTLKREGDDTPNNLRFIERSGRYILQELIRDVSSSFSATLRWRDVPLVRLT